MLDSKREYDIILLYTCKNIKNKYKLYNKGIICFIHMSSV